MRAPLNSSGGSGLLKKNSFRKRKPPYSQKKGPQSLLPNPHFEASNTLGLPGPTPEAGMPLQHRKSRCGPTQQSNSHPPFLGTTSHYNSCMVRGIQEVVPVSPEKHEKNLKCRALYNQSSSAQLTTAATCNLRSTGAPGKTSHFRRHGQESKGQRSGRVVSEKHICTIFLQIQDPRVLCDQRESQKAAVLSSLQRCFACVPTSTSGKPGNGLAGSRLKP